MQVLKIDESKCTIEATSREMARLSKLLGWISNSRPEMDESRIMLEHDQIIEALQSWTSFLAEDIIPHMVGPRGD